MDELVKALRETDFGDTCILCEHEDMCKCNDCIIIQAADAIEELSAYVRQIEELRKDGYYLQKTKMATCGQAIVTMPLPEPPKEG